MLIGWVAGAVVIFAISLHLMGAGEPSGPDGTSPSTYSRSAIGHAGIAEVLQKLGLPVVKSTYNSLEKLTPGSVLVIAEPHPSRLSEESIRTLLKADTILLVLSKWGGVASEQKPTWLRQARERMPTDAQWALRLVAPRAEVVRERGEVKWTTNALGLAPNLASPAQLVRGQGLRAIVGGPSGMLVAEVTGRDRKVWVLSDPDVISNHGLAREGNAALAVALIKRLRGGEGVIVFDETVHGYVSKPMSPFLLMFRFPFVIATVQGLIAVALLLWATMARFGAPQTAPPPLSAGRAGLLAEHGQADRVHRSSAGDDRPLRAGNPARGGAPAARAARARGRGAGRLAAARRQRARRRYRLRPAGPPSRSDRSEAARGDVLAGAPGARYSPLEGSHPRWTFKTSARSLRACAARSARPWSARMRSSS